MTTKLNYTITTEEIEKFQPTICQSKEDTYLMYPTWCDLGVYVAPVYGGYAAFDEFWKVQEECNWIERFDSLAEALAYCQ